MVGDLCKPIIAFQLLVAQQLSSPLHIYHQTLHNSIGSGDGSLRARDFAFWYKKASTQNPIQDVLARSIEPLNDAPRGC